MKKNIWKYILSALFYTTVLGVQGQDMTFPSMRVGLTPSSILNLFPAFQASFDKGLGPRTNFALEAGYIFSSETAAQGIRLRPGIEYIVDSGKNIALIGGLQMNTRYTVEYRNVITDTRTGQFEYIRYNQRRDRLYIGLNLSAALIFKISKRIYLEVGGGLGVATYQIFENQPLTEGDRLDLFGSPFTPEVSFDYYPIFYPHLNFSYDISKSEENIGDRKRSKRRN